MEKYVIKYENKWNEYLVQNNISEDNERTFTWGWQFDDTTFINSPELLLGCYLYNYSFEDVKNNLNLIRREDYYYDFAQKAIKIMEECQ